MSEGIQPQTFVAHSGETVILTPIAITNADGTPTDLTGAALRFGMSRRPRSDAIVRSNGGSPNCSVAVVGLPINGQARVTIPAATTEALDGTYYWELWITDFALDEVVAAYGYAEFRPNMF